ncbi:MAG: hypothetical protein HXX13_01220 [Bacteroidetes bacterium]|nr:hypothetical protein [Bacteroidota bacterium]
MTDPNLGRILIDEGSILYFKVMNIVSLQDNRDYYILEDPNGLKHFIDAEAYATYGIKIGSKLKCKVDKINCTGRILLEPEHPIYVDGQTYFFKVISVNESGVNNNIVVEDIFQNRIEVNIQNIKNQLGKDVESLKAVVIKVKKGRPILEFVD